MRQIITLSIVILMLSACSNKKQAPAPPQEEIPQALTEGNKSISSYKRAPTDLLEELYEELKDKNTQLNDLDDKIGSLPREKSDAMAAFLVFDEKNKNYYQAAEMHLGRITDSLLKMRVAGLINASLQQYNSRIQPTINLEASLNSKHTRLHDLYQVLKLVKTLPVMDKFQQKNLPSATPLQQLGKEYDKAILQTDSLAKN